MRPDASVVRQLVRFGVVGVSSNIALYVGYLGLTILANMAPMAAMSVVYAIGVALTFIVNRGWSFQSRVAPERALVRYVAAYAAGYLFNLAVLFALVDGLGVPHQGAQAIGIVATATLLFIVQRHWVFKDALKQVPV